MVGVADFKVKEGLIVGGGDLHFTNDQAATIEVDANTSGTGKALTISAGDGSGSNAGGAIVLKTAAASAGLTNVLTLAADNSATFTGAVSGVTTLAIGGGLSGATTIGMNGALSGASNIDGTGDLTMGSVTMTGFTVSSTGVTVAKTLALDPDSAAAGGLVITNSTNQTSANLVNITGYASQVALRVTTGDTHLGTGNSLTAGASTLGATTTGALTLGGDIGTAAAQDWDLVDNTASALSFDAAGKAGILEIDTQNDAEGISTSGYLTSTGLITGSAAMSLKGNLVVRDPTAPTTHYATISATEAPTDATILGFTVSDTEGGSSAAIEFNMTDKMSVRGGNLLVANKANGGTTYRQVIIGDASDATTNAHRAYIVASSESVFRVGLNDTTTFMELGQGATMSAGLSQAQEVTAKAGIVMDTAGNVRRIGMSTHSDGEFLKYDLSNRKWISGAATISGLNADDIDLGDSAVTIMTSSGAINIGHQDHDEAINIGTGTHTGVITVGNTTTGSMTIDSGSTLSIDSKDTTNFTMTASDNGTKTMTISAVNGGSGSSLLALSGDVISETAGTGWTVISPSAIFADSTSTVGGGTTELPVVEIRNTKNDATGPYLRLNNYKGTNRAGADGDVAGTIQFLANDIAENNDVFGQIKVVAAEVGASASGDEQGTMTLGVATGDSGSVKDVITILGAADTAENSLVTIAGDLTVDGTTTTINSTVMTVDDLHLTLASGAGDAAAANGAGILIDGADESIVLGSSGTRWDISAPVSVTGSVTSSAAITDGAASSFTTGTTIGDLTLANGSITSSGAAISFGAENLSTSGTVSTGALTVVGDIGTTAAARDWDLVDNNASALSFDATGASGILEIVTTDNAEGVKMSKTLDVVGKLSHNATAFMDSTSGTIESTNATEIFAFPYATYSAAKVIVSIWKSGSSGLQRTISEFLITYDGIVAPSSESNINFTEYAVVDPGGSLGTFTCDKYTTGNADTVRLLFTAPNSTEITYRAVGTLLKI